MHNHISHEFKIEQMCVMLSDSFKKLCILYLVCVRVCSCKTFRYILWLLISLRYCINRKRQMMFFFLFLFHLNYRSLFIRTSIVLFHACGIDTIWKKTPASKYFMLVTLRRKKTDIFLSRTFRRVEFSIRIVC